LPKFNEVLSRAKQVCVAGSSDGGRSNSRTKDDMLKYISEISYKIDSVTLTNNFKARFNDKD
jgi:hypothetical protein